MKTAAEVWELGTTGFLFVKRNTLFLILCAFFFSYLPLNLSNEPDGIVSWITSGIELTYIYSIKQKMLEMFEDSSTLDML